MLGLVEGRNADSTAAITDSRTIQPTPRGGTRSGPDGGKRYKGSKVHTVVDTPEHLLDLHVTAASEQDRAQVGTLCETTGESVESIYADQGCTGQERFDEPAGRKIILEAVKLPEAKKRSALLPRRWAAERSFG